MLAVAVDFGGGAEALDAGVLEALERLGELGGELGSGGIKVVQGKGATDCLWLAK